MAIQYCAVRKMPVRSQSTSAATVAMTDRMARAVYSGIVATPPAPPAEHRADGLVGQQPADRDDHEEDDLLEGHVEREAHAGRVPLAVRPVAGACGRPAPAARTRAAG